MPRRRRFPGAIEPAGQTMRYMFLIYGRETDMAERSAAELERLKTAHRAVIAETRTHGIFVGAERLHPTATSTTVRIADGKPVILDGPFAETKEQLAGYYILECRDLDEAIAWAAKIPTACQGGEGCIEIRPVAEIPAR
jgi:hypothetical protein